MGFYIYTFYCIGYPYDILMYTVIYFLYPYRFLYVYILSIEKAM